MASSSEANRSLSILAAIANEHRAVLKRQQGVAQLQQGAVPLKKRRFMHSAGVAAGAAGAAAVPMMIPTATRGLMIPTANVNAALLVPTMATNLVIPTTTVNAAVNRFVMPTGNLSIVPTVQPPTLVVPKAEVQPRRMRVARKEPEAATPVVAEPGPVEAAPKPAPEPQVTPKQYLQELFKEAGIGPKQIPQRYTKGDFVRPDTKECDSYNAAALLVRTNNLEKLREMHEQGKNLDACNRVGESLLHLACRRGHVAVAEFLMTKVKVRCDHQDDFGRTVLHDACWRPTPSLELMDALLKVVSPEWLMAQDVRGHTPFDYARREHAGAWHDFLVKREEQLKKRLAQI